MCAERRLRVEPYGVDISPALISHARQRLPHWADRLWIGDALTWTPLRTFDVVHGLLDTVRTEERRALIGNLPTFVSPGGRLVLSQYAGTLMARQIVEPLGFTIERELGLGVWLRSPQ